MKCTTTENVQELISRLENEAAEKLAKEVAKLAQIKGMDEFIPKVTDDEDDPWSDVEDNLPEVEVKAAAPPSLDKKRRGKDENPIEPDSISKPPKKKQKSKGADDSSSEEEWEDEQHDPKKDLSKSKSLESKEPEPLPILPSVPTSNPTVAVLSPETPEPVKPPSPAQIRRTRAKKLLVANLSAKNERAKVREDGFIAEGIRAHMQATIASFEEDHLTQVIASALSSQDPGLALQATRCPKLLCDFCGLSDSALGSPLLRFPNTKEWTEAIAHHITHRPCRLIAAIPNPASKTIKSEETIKSKETIKPEETI